MTSPEHADLATLLDADRLRKRMAWERDRARNTRRNPPSDSPENDYAPIEFPDTAGLRHAAMVVAGHFADDPDAIEATREVLEALAIPHIMTYGGDGRTLKVQRGKVRFGDEPAATTFSVEDADARPAKRNRRKAADA